MSAIDELRQAADTLERRIEAAQTAAIWFTQEADQCATLGDSYVDDSALIAARLVNGGVA